MRQIAFLWLVSIFSLGSQTSQANSFKFKVLNSTNGFPQNSIRAIAEDQTGFLWLGTEGGLIRYDGINTRVFRNDPSDAASLPENVIDSLLVDRSNRIWVGTVGNGLSLFDPATNKFQNFDSNITGDVIHKLFLSHSGDILIGASKGVFSISPKNLSLKQLANSTQLKDAFNIAGLWEDKDKTVWIATLHGYLFSYNSKGVLSQLGGKFSSKFTNLKYTKQHGLLLSAAKQGLFHIDTNKRKLTQLLTNVLPAKSVIYDIAESRKGALWIASNVGLLQLKKGAKSLVLIRSNPNDVNSLSQNDLRTLFVSKKDLLWIGTKTKGLNALNLKAYGFYNIAPFNPITIPLDTKENPSLDSLTIETNLDDSTIWSIFKDSAKGLWIGTNKGLDYKANGESSFRIFNTLGTGKNTLNIYEAMALTEANGLLWIGTYDKGLIGYDVENNIVRHHFWPDANDKRNRLSGKIVRILKLDKKRNSLWVGTKENGLNKINLKTYEITQYKQTTNDKNSLPHKSIRALYLAPDNRLWVGTGNGLSVFNESSNNFNSLIYSSGTSGLSDEDVRAFYQTDENTIWVATGNGLNKLSVSPLKVISRLGEKQGLAESTLYTLIPDEFENLWITTLDGLSQFNPKTSKFTNYYAYHDLQDNEFNFNAWHYDANDKEIYVGGINGVSYFKPSNLSDSYKASDPIVVGVDAFDENLNQHHLKNTIVGSLENNDPITLDTNLRRLNINFSSLEFIAPQRIRYRYRLVGLESKWNNANIHEQKAVYTNLNHGHYSFELESLNDNSIDSNPKLTIPFYIQPTLFETLWFKILLSLVGLLLLWLLFLYRERIIRKKVIDGERLQHYRKVVHELKTPLIHVRSLLNRLDNDSNIDKSTDMVEIISSSKTNIRRSLHFLDQLHSVVKLNSQQTEKSQDFLLEELVDEALLPFLDPSDSSKKRIQISDYDKESIVRTFDGSIYLILNNLVSNALKYSPSNTPINLKIKVKNKDLIIECLNQGTTISSTAEKALYQPHKRFHTSSGTEGLGLGLHIIKQVVNYHDGFIKLENNLPHGNHFIIQLRNIVL